MNLRRPIAVSERLPDEMIGLAPDDDPPPADGPEGYDTAEGPQATETPEPFSGLPLTVEEWIGRDLPEPDFLLGHLLSTTSRVLLAGKTGIGKSNFLIDLGMACAAGADFLHWRGRRPARVLYIDGEMSRRLLRQRIINAVGRLGYAPDGFHALSHEDIEGFAPLNTAAGQACIERVIESIGGVDLLILDSVMCLIAGDMKDEEGWAATMPWVRSLTRRNMGQIWGHHTGHDETRSYGTKTREWQLDTVGLLEANERPGTDVAFTLEFRKARERTPATRADFETVRIALIEDRWQCDAADALKPTTVSPLGMKFRDALVNALVSDGVATIRGKKAATSDQWKAECIVLGLIDPATKPESARGLFNKYKRELIGGNRSPATGRIRMVPERPRNRPGTVAPEPPEPPAKLRRNRVRNQYRNRGTIPLRGRATVPPPPQLPPAPAATAPSPPHGPGLGSRCASPRRAARLIPVPYRQKGHDQSDECIEPW